jgi:5-methylcytosine-specific restriction protein A
MEDEEIGRSDLPKASIQERGSYRLHRAIERNSKGAQQAKRHHGYTCQACDFKFEDKFGEIGKDFIEAHHLKPLSKIKPGQIVTYDIATDFAVLCSNCHRMIHRTDDPSDLQGFRKLLRRLS